MTKYLLNRRFLTSLALLAFATVPFSCTTVELDFGSGLIPDSEKMQVAVDVIDGTKMYNIQCDSIPTNGFKYPYIGSVVDPLFGGTDFSFVTTYIPGYFKNDSIWGDEPKIDSVFLEFIADNRFGDSLQTLNISVKELINPLPYPKQADSVYYSNFDIKPYLSDRELISFTMPGPSYRKRVRVDNSFAERFLDTTGQIFVFDSLFIKKYPGLYFESETFNTTGIVYTMETITSTIRIYYHNKNKPKADTTSVDFLLQNTSNNLNEQFTLIKHNYNLADPIVGINPASINKDEAQKKIYIQAFSGVMGRIEFPKERIDAIINDAKEKGFSTIAVNNARVKFNVNVPSVVNLDTALTRLGIMVDYETKKLIKDYYPYDEKENNPSAPDFDGYLNRALNCYTMDITGYVQSLFNGNKDPKYSLELSTAFGFDETFKGVVLDGGGVGTSGQVEITYTMLK